MTSTFPCHNLEFPQINNLPPAVIIFSIFFTKLGCFFKRFKLATMSLPAGGWIICCTCEEGKRLFCIHNVFLCFLMCSLTAVLLHPTRTAISLTGIPQSVTRSHGLRGLGGWFL